MKIERDREREGSDPRRGLLLELEIFGTACWPGTIRPGLGQGYRASHLLGRMPGRKLSDRACPIAQIFFILKKVFILKIKLILLNYI